MRQLNHEQTSFKEINFPIVLLLDNITGEANLGSIFRLADAFSVKKIILTGTPPNLESNRLKKTSRSTHNRVNQEFQENALEAVKDLSENGYKIYGLEITSDSIPVHEFSYQSENSICLVLGNEISGINEQILSLCDQILHIDMYGKNSSMNVSHAAGIALYEITKTISAFNKK